MRELLRSARRVSSNDNGTGEGWPGAFLSISHTLGATMRPPPCRASHLARALATRARTASSSVWRCAAWSWPREDRGPSESKSDDYRVSITPAVVRELTARRARLLVQSGAARAARMAKISSLRMARGSCPMRRRVFVDGRSRVEGQGAQAPRWRCCAPANAFTYLHLAAEPDLRPGLQ